jgi:hypothetical protein
VKIRRDSGQFGVENGENRGIIGVDLRFLKHKKPPAQTLAEGALVVK